MNPLTPFLSGIVFAVIIAAGIDLVTPAEAGAMAAAPECMTVEHAKPDIPALIAAMPANIKAQRQDEIGSLIGGLK